MLTSLIWPARDHLCPPRHAVARNNVSLVYRSFAALLVCVLLGGVAGCGGEEDSSVPASPTADPAEEDPSIGGKEEVSPDEGEDGTESDPQEGEGEPESEVEKEPEPEPEPEVSERPEEVSKWGATDYVSAKKDSDRRLLEAVNHLADRYEGNEKVAKTLVQLLVNEPPPEQPEPKEGEPERNLQPIQVSRGIANSIIQALGKSKTAAAGDALLLLLYGKLETPLEQRAALVAALTAMGENCSEYEPYEDALFAAITAPNEIINKSRHTELKTVTLQYFATEALNNSPSERVRLRLAKFLDDPQVPQETAQVVEELLSKELPSNIPAQIHLYQNAHTQKQTKGRIGYTLDRNSTRAIELLLGIPEKLETPPPPGTLSRPSINQGKSVDDHREQYFSFARRFWTPELLTFLDTQIKDKGIGNASESLGLLGAAPRKDARFLMSELLSFFAFKGPRHWQSASLLGRNTSDPGFIVLAKQVYQRQSQRSGTVVSRPDEKRPRVDEAMREAWQNSTQGAVEQWFTRCYSAARKAHPPMQSETAEDEMKIHLHPKANIVAQYHMNWPADAQTKLPDFEIAPLKMHYYRIEEDGIEDKLVAKYQRYAGKGSRGKTHKIRGGQWLDGLTNGSEPKSKLSIDIRITSEAREEDTKTPGSEKKPVPVVIEILTVEIPIPKAPKSEKISRRK